MSPDFYSPILPSSKPPLGDLTKCISGLSSSLYWEWAHKICLDLENPFLLQQWVVPVGRNLLYNNHLVQLSDHNLNYIIKDIVQMLFKHWQIWGITNPFRKTVPVFAHPLTKEMLHKVKSKPPWCGFEPFPRVLPLDSREIGSSLSTSPPQEAGERNEITPHLFHYKLDKPRVVSCW